MLSIPILLLLSLLLLFRGSRFRLLQLFAVCWLVTLAPVATGIIEYEPSVNRLELYPVVLSLLLLCFLIGYVAVDSLCPSNRMVFGKCNRVPVLSTTSSVSLVKLLTFLGMLGSLLQVVDILSSGVNVFAGIAESRESYASRNVGVLAQVGVLLSWGSLYAAVFIVSSFPRLTLGWRLVSIVSLFSYVAIAIASVGRQTVFQLALVVVMSYLFAKRDYCDVAQKFKSRTVLIIVIGLAIGYMFFVAWARNDGAISEDKIEVLKHYFNFTIASWFMGILDALPDYAASGVVEGLVYFTSSIALFGEFLGTDSGGPYFGAFSFPLFFRRFEWLAGFSVVDAMTARSVALDSANIMPVAWYTAFSSLVSDFGIYTTPFFVFFWGALAAWSWHREYSECSVQSRVLLVCMCISIVYMPLSLFTGDPNVFLMFIFSLIPMRYLRCLRFR